jgi:peptidoglycan biosynthesis protein MviN/MurJ (putative lipid II flippase)
LFAAWTLADNRHVNTLAEALPPLGILFVVLLMGGITPLVFGTVLGLLFQVIFLGASLMCRGQLEKPLFHLEHRCRNMLLGGAGVMILGQGLMSGVALVDQFAAARLVPGSLATLGYANRILGLVLTLGSIVAARAVLPIFSAAYVSSKEDYNGLALQWGWKALYFGVVTAAASILSAEWIVKTLFQRGEFGTAESNIVSSALRYGFVQLPFFLCSTVLVNALLGAHRRSLLIPLGGLALATKLGLVLWLLPKLGLKGLLLSTAGVYFATSLAIIIIFKRCASPFARKL